MRIKRIAFLTAIVALSFARKGMATWDTSTPAGTEAKSLGDDRIREFKTDVQTALNAYGVFPGSDTANPKYVWTVSSGTTAQRPTNPATGQMYVNVQIGHIERFIGNNSWGSAVCEANYDNTSIAYNASLQLAVKPHGIDPTMLTASIAGSALGGGDGAPLHLQYNTNTFTVTSDTLTITSTFTAPGVVQSGGQPTFFAKSGASQTNVTGDNTTVTVTFGTEVYDKAGNYNGTDTFVAPQSGTYLFSYNVLLNDLGAGNKCEAWLEIAGAAYSSVEFWPSSGISLPSTVVASLSAGNAVKVKCNCSGGAKVIDFLTTTTVGNPGTFFSGVMLP